MTGTRRTKTFKSQLTRNLPNPPPLSCLSAFYSVLFVVVILYLWDHFNQSLSPLVGSRSSRTEPRAVSLAAVGPKPRPRRVNSAAQ